MKPAKKKKQIGSIGYLMGLPGWSIYSLITICLMGLQIAFKDSQI